MPALKWRRFWDLPCLSVGYTWYSCILYLLIHSIHFTGLYTVEKFWFTTGLSGYGVYKFALQRIKDQAPPPWEIRDNAEDGSESGYGSQSDKKDEQVSTVLEIDCVSKSCQAFSIFSVRRTTSDKYPNLNWSCSNLMQCAELPQSLEKSRNCPFWKSGNSDLG